MSNQTLIVAGAVAAITIGLLVAYDHYIKKVPEDKTGAKVNIPVVDPRLNGSGSNGWDTINSLLNNAPEILDSIGLL